jgi:hypothetical protein
MPQLVYRAIPWGFLRQSGRKVSSFDLPLHHEAKETAQEELITRLFPQNSGISWEIHCVLKGEGTRNSAEREYGYREGEKGGLE